LPEPSVPDAAPPSPEDRGTFVLQTRTIGNITRLLLLSGDPHQAWEERAAWVAVDVLPGHAPAGVVEGLVDRLVGLFREVGEKEWDRELRVREWIRRGHLEVVK